MSRMPDNPVRVLHPQSRVDIRLSGSLQTVRTATARQQGICRAGPPPQPRTSARRWSGTNSPCAAGRLDCYGTGISGRRESLQAATCCAPDDRATTCLAGAADPALDKPRWPNLTTTGSPDLAVRRTKSRWPAGYGTPAPTLIEAASRRNKERPRYTRYLGRFSCAILVRLPSGKLFVDQ